MNFGVCVARSWGWALAYSLDARGNSIQGSQKLYVDFPLRGVWHPNPSIVPGSAIKRGNVGLYSSLLPGEFPSLGDEQTGFAV